MGAFINGWSSIICFGSSTLLNKSPRISSPGFLVLRGSMAFSSWTLVLREPSISASLNTLSVNFLSKEGDILFLKSFFCLAISFGSAPRFPNAGSNPNLLKKSLSLALAPNDSDISFAFTLAILALDPLANFFCISLPLAISATSFLLSLTSFTISSSEKRNPFFRIFFLNFISSFNSASVRLSTKRSFFIILLSTGSTGLTFNKLSSLDSLDKLSVVAPVNRLLARAPERGAPRTAAILPRNPPAAGTIDFTIIE